MSSNDSNQRIVSGMRPTGRLHLGHLHGVLNNWVQLQHEYECFFFVADYHALTTEHDREAMRKSTYEVTSYFLSFGLDPNRAAFFRQSDVPEVTELSWMLSCVTAMGLLDRAHAYKAAKDRGEE